MKKKKDYFDIFCEKFIELKEDMGLQKYDATFKKTNTNDTYKARIFLNAESCSANIEFNGKYKFKDVPEVIRTAIHECSHLFLSDLSYLASERDTAQKTIDRCIEGMCNTLERLL